MLLLNTRVVHVQIIYSNYVLIFSINLSNNR